ncbi:Fc.00g100060.m01.CDS01 [Cosmosporella sp. VM-42]
MGARLLGEVEEVNLEEIFHGLRSAFDLASTSNTANSTHTGGSKARIKATHIESLDQLAIRHYRSTQSSTLSLSGRHLPLLYTLISALVSPPDLYTLFIIDLDNRFDATRLTCSSQHIRHVYIQRPARSSPDRLRALVADAETFMLYGDASRQSSSREWWGTVVLGGLGAGDIVAGWKGWLRVERENVRGFTLGISAEEAMEQRSNRAEAVESAGWAATSQWGGFVFKEED